MDHDSTRRRAVLQPPCCVDSLSASLNDVGQARAMQQARGKCLDKGLTPASPELAECHLELLVPQKE
ncbi:MAG: hypothetical protein JWQ52_494 [Phenylobacterium sp.]|jgi:hypothetical protein|nr:hypothetical protein [Phenylobacterium sp.]